MTIVPSPMELADLAEVMRPGWRRPQFEGALEACRASGWPWPRTFRVAALVMADEDGEPRDILAAAQSPLARQPVDAPAATARGGHLARAALAAQGIGPGEVT